VGVLKRSLDSVAYLRGPLRGRGRGRETKEEREKKRRGKGEEGKREVREGREKIRGRVLPLTFHTLCYTHAVMLFFIFFVILCYLPM